MFRSGKVATKKLGRIPFTLDVSCPPPFLSAPSLLPFTRPRLLHAHGKMRSQAPKWQRLWSRRVGSVPGSGSCSGRGPLERVDVDSFTCPMAPSTSCSSFSSPFSYYSSSFSFGIAALLCTSIVVWHFVLFVALFAQLSLSPLAAIVAMASPYLPQLCPPPLPDCVLANIILYSF